MKAIQKAQFRSRMALQLLAASALAASLAGCYQTDTAQVEYPFDYRQRHPITVREGAQNVEVMVGRNRGGLTPSQRADVVAFAQAWRREFEQRHYHRDTARRPNGSCSHRLDTRNPFHSCRRRGADQRDLRASLSSNPICAGQHQAQLFEAGRGGRTLRGMAEGPWHILQVGRHGQSAVLESRLRESTQSRGNGRKSG